MPRAHTLATELLQNSPSSLRATKALLTGYTKERLDDQLRAAIRENAAVRQTPDFKEGITSFLEKRKPKWTSR
jgi:enoyl-CoA hydratase/carnithine racemase